MALSAQTGCPQRGRGATADGTRVDAPAPRAAPGWARLTVRYAGARADPSRAPGVGALTRVRPPSSRPGWPASQPARHGAPRGSAADFAPRAADFAPRAGRAHERRPRPDGPQRGFQPRDVSANLAPVTEPGDQRRDSASYLRSRLGGSRSDHTRKERPGSILRTAATRGVRGRVSNGAGAFLPGTGLAFIGFSLSLQTGAQDYPLMDDLHNECGVNADRPHGRSAPPRKYTRMGILQP